MFPFSIRISLKFVKKQILHKLLNLCPCVVTNIVLNILIDYNSIYLANELSEIYEIDGLVQGCSNSIANAMELLQFCTTAVLPDALAPLATNSSSGMILIITLCYWSDLHSWNRISIISAWVKTYQLIWWQSLCIQLLYASQYWIDGQKHIYWQHTLS